MRAESAIRGAVGGLAGASCMTALRLAARRAGWIDQPFQQQAEGRLFGAITRRKPGRLHPHQLAAEGMHLGYGAAWGAAFGALGGAPQRWALTGALFGLANWAFGFLLATPAAKLAKPPARTTTTANLVNVAAHALYGMVTALYASELSRQDRTTPRARWIRRGAHAG